MTCAEAWTVAGTWFAGIATLLAAGVALHLARRSERVGLRIFVGVRDMVGGGTAPTPYLCFDVTNIGPRPVVITNVGWVIGKRKSRRYCIQILERPPWTQCPAELPHGHQALFMVGLTGTLDWAREFITDFVKDERLLKTLRVQVFTSVGQTFELQPEPGVIDRLRQAFKDQADQPNGGA